MLFKTALPLALEKEQLELKARTIGSVVGKLGLQATVVGETDLASGPQFALDVARNSGYELLSANVTDENGKNLFPSNKIVEVGGVKVGLFGITNRLLSSAPGHAGLKVKDPFETAMEQVAYLKSRCRVIICLSHMGGHADRQLARQVDGIDLIIGGHSREMTTDPVLMGESVIVQAYSQGKYVGRLDVEMPRTRPARTNWVYIRRHGQSAELKPEDASVKSVFVALDKHMGDDPDVLAEIKAYNAAVSELAKHRARKDFEPMGGLEGSKSKIPPGQKVNRDTFTYWGHELCSSCHAEQAAFWKTTSHSHAIDILKEKGRVMDQECIGCHTTGFRKPGGFALPEGMKGFENVQCESCHGPGSEHGKGGMASRSLAKTTCVACHDPKNSPEFDFELLLPMMSCPTMEQSEK